MVNALMDVSQFLFPAYFVTIGLVAALNSRVLGAATVLSIGLMAVYPDENKALFIWLFLIPAAVLSGFRD